MSDDVAVCREALEVLCIAVALHPSSIEVLSKDKSWHTFVIDTLLLTPVPTVRAVAEDQFFLIATRCQGRGKKLHLFCHVNFLKIVSRPHFFQLSRNPSAFSSPFCSLCSTRQRQRTPVSHRSTSRSCPGSWLPLRPAGWP